MKCTKFFVDRLAIRFLLICLFSIVLNQAYAGFEIKKHSINNGGSTMSSNRYQMTSSIGQVDAAEVISGAHYQINTGFWNNTETSPNNDLIFKNSFE